jgi:hypothetical protein
MHIVFIVFPFALSSACSEEARLSADYAVNSVIMYYMIRLKRTENQSPKGTKDELHLFDAANGQFTILDPHNGGIHAIFSSARNARLWGATLNVADPIVLCPARFFTTGVPKLERVRAQTKLILAGGTACKRSDPTFRAILTVSPGKRF